MKRALVQLLCVLAVCCVASGKVVLIGNNITLSFDDTEANFAPAIKGAGEVGILYLADPLDACSDLTNEVEHVTNGSSPFVLIIRGGCSFEYKVKKAQKAGFKAAIVYDNEDDGGLVAMAGNSAGIDIHAVFITKSSGETLKRYAGSTDVEVLLSPSFKKSALSVMAISFISLLAMSAVLATCFFVRRHRLRRRLPQSFRVREFHGMSRRLVKAMPSLIFTSVLEDNSTSTTCAICLEDYSVGEKLRVLPCHHKFHAFCVDSWLTSWRTFCPVCKRDARTSTGEPPVSESTPLLSSAPSSVTSSMRSSFRSSIPTTASGLQIAPMASISSSVSFSTAHASVSFVQHSSFRSPHRQPLPMNVSRSSVDLRRQASESQRSFTSHMVSATSLGFPAISPFNARYMSPNRPSPGNASPSVVNSSGHLFQPLRPSESAGTFSSFASSHSLSDC